MAKKATKKKTTRRKKAPDPKEIWDELKGQVNVESATNYSMGGTFESNTAIQHPKFGIGVVTEAMSNKIEVTFEDGPKALVHNRK